MIARAVENSYSEESGPTSVERTPTAVRNLRNDWRSESVPSYTSYPKKLSASTEQRVEHKEAQEAQDNTVLSAKEERERQRSITIVDSSAFAS